VIPPYSSRVGRLLRFPLRLIPASARVRILAGPSKGLKWIVGSGSHGYWLGVYEAKKRRAVESHLRRGDVFYDVGAHVGYFALAASRLVGSEGLVLAIEPVPENAARLLEHVQLNNLDNVVVVAAACSGTSGSAPFVSGRNSSTGHLSPEGPVTVRTVTIDQLAEEYRGPTVLKIDAEGAESVILQGATQTLSSLRPVVIFATHGPENEREAQSLLEKWGYRVHPLPDVQEEFIAIP
jgi:FkbM family methyltransferase